MDKFVRRPSARERRRKLGFLVLAFLAVGGWFATLFVFGNQGAPWLLAVYGVLIVVLGRMRFKEELSFSRLAARNTPLQSTQGPGFSPMEVAAVQALVEHVGPQVAPYFRNAEVILRWNTGSGCLTAIRSSTPVAINDQALEFVSWFEVRGLSSPVGCRFWKNQETIDVMEFFCAGERTVDLDWHRVEFSSAPAGDQRTVPASRPTIDLEQLIAMVAVQSTRETPTPGAIPRRG